MSGDGAGLATVQELRSVDMLSFFDQELRPVFCLDTREDGPIESLKPIFQNTFLRVSGLWGKLVPLSTPVLPGDDPAYHFIKWAKSAYEVEVESTRFVKYEGIHWSKTVLLDRWMVIAGTPCATPVDFTQIDSGRIEMEKALQNAQQGLLRGVVDQGYRDLSTPDSTSVSHEDSWAVDRGHVVGRPEPSEFKFDSTGLDKATGHPSAQRSREWFDDFDWGSTPLGPRESWASQLKRLVKLMLMDPWPAAIFWGPQRIILYNEHYQWILGRKHPFAMGKPFDVVWLEVEDSFKLFFEKAATERMAVSSDDTEFHIERDGFIEQTYFSWSILPITDDEDENVVGFYNPTRETTVQKTLYRRMALLLGLSQSLGTANTVADYWPQVVNGLDVGACDVPFLLIYGAEDLGGDHKNLLMRSQAEVKRWELKGTIGYPKDVHNLPTSIDCDDVAEGMETFVSRVRKAQEPILISTTDGSFPARLMTTVHTRSFGESCSNAIICPIRPFIAHSSSSTGFIVLGLNPRRPYDDDYRIFVQLLMRQIASSMSAVLLFTDAVRQGKNKAKLLSRQLATQTKIAEDNELRFQRMADHAPVAIFRLTPDGRLEYGNEDYFELTETSSDDDTPFAIRKSVHDDYQNVVVKQWERVTVDHAHANDELRLKKRWISPDGTTGSTWVVQAAYPELDTDGKLVGVLGCLTDISRQKWAEEIQSQRTEQALELKRQQEMFIDMTSHELRNPLSAVIQCADGIISSFDKPELCSSGQVCIDSADAISAVDAAQTIIFCAQHQKRISDDVLILSKLNSDLVVITPVDAQPVEVIRSGIRVFDRELKKNSIRLSVQADSSYHHVGVDSVRLDPSRVLQVLINLVSNAIKFTVPRRRREIDVRFGASLTTDIEELRHLRFWGHDPKSANPGSTSSEECGDGEVVYIYISVRDTGHGLRQDEMDNLFQRFSQATPRTHIQYGGSGLGLFISKRLAEAQGGAIGVSSVPKKGSTFAFYIKTRRSPPSAVLQPIDVSVADAAVTDEKRQIRVSIPTAEDWSRFAYNTMDSGEQSMSFASSAFLSPSSPSFTPLSSSSTDEARSSMATQQNGRREALHVLIVEDNLINQKVLAKQLEKAGYFVAIANHGVEALNFLRRTACWKDFGDEATAAPPAPPAQPVHPFNRPSRRRSSGLSAESDHLGLVQSNVPSRTSSYASSSGRSARTEHTPEPSFLPGTKLDIVLMDIEMPVMDGITCVRRIRELQNEGKLSRLPVIAVTANARPEQIDAAKQAGMDSVVCKPFRIPQLTKEIDNMLERTTEESQ